MKKTEKQVKKLKKKVIMIKNKNKADKSKKTTVSFTEKSVEMTKPNESQDVKVKGTGKMLASKSKTATWY